MSILYEPNIDNESEYTFSTNGYFGGPVLKHRRQIYSLENDRSNDYVSIAGNDYNYSTDTYLNSLFGQAKLVEDYSQIYFNSLSLSDQGSYIDLDLDCSQADEFNVQVSSERKITVLNVDDSIIDIQNINNDNYAVVTSGAWDDYKFKVFGDSTELYSSDEESGSSKSFYRVFRFDVQTYNSISMGYFDGSGNKIQPGSRIENRISDNEYYSIDQQLANCYLIDNTVPSYLNQLDTSHVSKIVVEPTKLWGIRPSDTTVNGFNNIELQDLSSVATEDLNFGETYGETYFSPIGATRNIFLEFPNPAFQEVDLEQPINLVFEVSDIESDFTANKYDNLNTSYYTSAEFKKLVDIYYSSYPKDFNESNINPGNVMLRYTATTPSLTQLRVPGGGIPSADYSSTPLNLGLMTVNISSLVKGSIQAGYTSIKLIMFYESQYAHTGSHHIGYRIGAKSINKPRLHFTPN